MHRLVLLIAVLTACPASKEPVMPKKPNNELVVGDFERHKPDGEQALRFKGDGSFVMAKNKGELDKVQPIATGQYKLEGDQLTFLNERGACTEAAGEKSGSYKVVISKIGIRFQKLDDRCQRRATIDGQTWWRIQ